MKNMRFENMNYLIKKSIFLLKNYGVRELAYRIIHYLPNRFSQNLKSLSLNIKAKKNLEQIIYSIRQFNSDDPDNIFDFSRNFYEGIIRPIQFKSEFVELLKIFKMLNPKYILEIGIAKGGTLFCFCKLAKEDATIIGVDLENYPDWRLRIFEAFKKGNQNLFILSGKDSHKIDTLNEIRSILKGQKLDFLFIDGDHTYTGVKKDFEMYSPLIREGGIIAFHDIVESKFDKKIEVSKFWNEIKSNYEYREIIADPNQDGAGIGVIIKK
jgi:predicted O-methyltransferase YrrM